MQKIILRYGLISGVLIASMIIITGLFSKSIGFDNGIYIGYATMIIGFTPIYVAMLRFRMQNGGGTIKFGTAAFIGLGVMIIGCVFYVAAWIFVLHTFMPDFMDRYTEYSVAKMKAAHLPQADIDKAAKQMMDFKEQYKNPLVQIGYTFLEPLPVGILLSLIASLVVRRTKIK